MKKPEIFSFNEDPLLASLISCLGLNFEIGNPDWDRLSPAIGASAGSNMKSEIITYNGEFGIRIWSDEIEEFTPRHEDFRFVLHPLSLVNNKLSQLVIFPSLVARNYKDRGVNLVIVKDWVLSTFLAEHSVNYLKTNLYEIETNSAKIQAELMSSKSISFSGTHDLVDHLLGGSKEGFEHKLFSDVQNVFKNCFTKTPAKKRSLLVSYLIGVLLDDLAQPIWYKSAAHHILLEKSLELLSITEKIEMDLSSLRLPQSFNHLINELRAGKTNNLDSIYEQFSNEIHLPTGSNEWSDSGSKRA